MNDMSNTPPPPTPLTAAEINAYLDYALASLFTRRDALIKALTLTAEMSPRIEDDAQLGDVAENVKMAGALGRTTEDRRVENKAPFLTGGRVVDMWFRAFVEPLDQAMAPVQRIMDDYGARKLARQRAEAEAARKAAQLEADRLAARAAAALDAGRDADAVLEQAALAADVATKADSWADARPAELTRARGVYGATASMRETWAWEIEDIGKIPRAYLMVNPDAIKAAAKARDASGKPAIVIPGIRWTSSTRMGVR